MVVGIWFQNEIQTHPIERLAELIHPMAAVAWDRDMADVDVVAHPFDPQRFPPLRFHQNMNDIWCAFSGDNGAMVARWIDDERRWSRTHR